MSKYFKNINSLEELKKQFKNLLKANHPDNGGDMTIKTYITKNVMNKMNIDNDFNQFVINSVHKHLSGDWGEISAEDTAANAENPLYAFSSYTAPDQTEIWLKQDYNVLTVLFPEEY